MAKNRKIDIAVRKAHKMFYLCSTEQSKTCKEAKAKFLNRYNNTNFSSSTGTWFIKDNISAFFAR